MAAVICIIDNAPWVIDFDVIEQVSVVPAFHFRQFCRKVIVSKHCFYFTFGKSEAVTVFGMQNTIAL